MSKKEILNSISVGQLVLDKRALVSVKSSDTIEKALDLLQIHHVLSLPILNEDAETFSSEPFIGVIDILDILVYLAFGNFSEMTKTVTSKDLSGDRLKTVTVGDIFGVANEMETQMWHSGLYVQESTKSVWDTMYQFQGGFQRVLIKSKDQFKVLSQIDVVAFLLTIAPQHAQLQSIMGKTIEEENLILPQKEFNELCTVFSDEKALNAYRKLLRHKADAVAVLERSTGELITTLSPSDLRFLHQKTGGFDLLLEPVSKFLEEIHYGSLRYPVTVSADSTLATAMNHCVFWKIHRVWVVSDAGVPIACVRLQDLLARFQASQ